MTARGLNCMVRTLCRMLLAAPVLAGCALMGDVRDPIPVEFVPAPRPGPERPLVIVLPGVLNDDDNLEKHGIARAIHAGWPEADVLLTGARYPYYQKGAVARRVHDEIVVPARRRGYREIWLAGGSLGGLGVLLYEKAYPGEMAGLVVLSPWLGDRDLIDEIRAAGGLSRWQPGPAPAEPEVKDLPREVLRSLKGWDAARRGRIWLACGRDDRMIGASRLLAGVLPPSHYFEGPGGHEWDFWLPATTKMFARVRERRPPEVATELVR